MDLHEDRNKKVPLLPFRMWLLTQVRNAGSVAEFARQIGRDAEEVRRWTNGYYWERDCEPRPIHNVTLKTVDKVMTAAGQHDQIFVIYPETDSD